MGNSQKIVVIGGVACGCKAAARARRLNPDLDITIVEQGSVLSYAGCGLPYYIQGKIGELRDLTSTPVGVPRNPNLFRSVNGIRALLSRGATVDRLANLDLAYAPPYSEALDNVIHAANVLRNVLDGAARKVTAGEVKARLDAGKDFLLLDVRSPQEFEAAGIDDPRVRLLPLGKRRTSLADLPHDKPIVTSCKVSLRGYEAQRVLSGASFADVTYLEGGISTYLALRVQKIGGVAGQRRA